MQAQIVSFLIGILSSLIASVVFLYYILTRLRPRIEISPYISLHPDLNIPDKDRYYLKFINKSKHDAYDIRIRLCELIRWPAANGKQHEQRKDLELKKDFMAHVPPFIKTTDKNTFAPHAIILTCLDDLAPILRDKNKCIELQLILRHGLTGLAKVYKFEYSDISSVKKGMFEFGNNLTIPNH